MITLSESAAKELHDFFADKEKSPIRVYLAPGGCHGPRLALALDAPGEDDEVFEQAGYSFCLSKELFAQTGDISIDVTMMGFAVEPANPLPDMGGGCSSCSGGCGAGQ